MRLSKYVISLVAANSFLAMANAQSSVTVFGIIDAGVSYGKGGLSNRTQLSQGNWAASRIGFRGAEDLGGGVAAGFWLEAAVTPDTGGGGGTNINNSPTGEVSGNGGLTFGRRAYVYLSAPMGEIRLGREYAPVYWNTVYSDVFGLSGVGASVAFTNAITGSTRSRASNSISYTTPKNASGIGLGYMHYMGEGASGTPSSQDGTGNQVRLSYDKGPMNAAVAYGRTKYASGDSVMTSIYGGWKFDALKLAGLLTRDELGSRVAHGVIFGITKPVGLHEIRASYSQYKINDAGSPKSQKIAVGDVYTLSKRSKLYATFAHVKNSGGATTALGGAIGLPNRSSSGMDFGVVHSF